MSVPNNMGRSKRDKVNRLPPFVAITWQQLNSAAFIDLCHYARAALPYFLGKVKLPYQDPSRLQTPFSFPYSEAKRLGFPTSTFSKAIKQLVHHGFIDPYRKGGCYGDLKVSNQFTLSERWKKYGTPAFETSNWDCFIPKPRKNSAPLGGGKSNTPSGEIHEDSS